MVTKEQYFRDYAHTPQHEANAAVLLSRVNALMDYMKRSTWKISGQKYGGFRPKDCPEGAENSAHKTGEAVDVYDPDNAIDGELNDFILTRFNLYREAPDWTKGWLHLTIRPPKSGKRSFIP